MFYARVCISEKFIWTRLIDHSYSQRLVLRIFPTNIGQLAMCAIETLSVPALILIFYASLG